MKIKKEDSQKVVPKITQNRSNPITLLLDKNPPFIISFLRGLILRAVSEIFPAAKLYQNAVKIEHPKVKNYGDYSTNIALILAGQLKLKPLDIAEKMSRKIGEYIKVGQMISIQSDSKSKNPMGEKANNVLESVEKVSPGFINFFVAGKWLITQMDGLLDNDWLVNTGKSILLALKNKKTVIEYTDPNPFKELHIGHLISNVTGESLARVREATGATVWRADYFGDVGVHAAKSIWGILKKMSEVNISLANLEEKPLAERINFLGQGYALGTKAYEEDEKAKMEIGRLNTVLYIAAQKMWEEQGFKSIINYDPEKKINSQEVDRVFGLYQTGRQWSLDYFEEIYQKLGTKFDGYYPESKVGETGYKLVTDNIGNVFEKSEGAVVFKAEKYGLHTRVFINKHNLPTYEAKELGLAPAKYSDFPYDESIIVVGKEIKEYFQVLVTALKEVIPQLGEITFPICTGMVKLPEGKMSSRTGNVVTVAGLLNALENIVRKKILKTDYSDSDKNEIAEKVGVAALKYAFLKNSVGQDFVFDLEKSLSLEGDSGPYLMYTYARAKSVLRKSKSQNSKVKTKYREADINEEEKELLRAFGKFEEVVWNASRNLAPSVICTYLYDLGQKFNLFYQKNPILTGEDKIVAFRLALTETAAVILKKGLYLLGIETVEKM